MIETKEKFEFKGLIPICISVASYQGSDSGYGSQSKKRRAVSFCNIQIGSNKLNYTLAGINACIIVPGGLKLNTIDERMLAGLRL